MKDLFYKRGWEKKTAISVLSLCFLMSGCGVGTLPDKQKNRSISNQSREIKPEIKGTVNVFLNQLTEMRADVAYLMDCRNWYELSRLADKIKSSALIMGIEQMADEMKELELLAIEGKNTEKYPEYVERLNAMIDVIRVELEPYVIDKQIDIIKV